MKCDPPPGSTLHSGSLGPATIEESHGTFLIIITCNPTFCFRYTNQDPNYPPGTYVPHPGVGAHAHITPA